MHEDIKILLTSWFSVTLLWISVFGEKCTNENDFILQWLCSYFMSECCTSSSSQWYLQLVVMFIFHVWMLYIIITVVSSARGYVHISCLNAVHHHHSGIFSSNVVMFIFHVWILYIIITVVSSALTRLCSYFMSECCTSSSQWYLQL